MTTVNSGARTNGDCDDASATSESSLHLPRECPVQIEELFRSIPEATTLRYLRDDIIRDEKIDKQSSLKVSSLCSTSELLLLDLHYKKEREIQEIKHELALMRARMNERDMLQGVANDILTLSSTASQQANRFETLESNMEAMGRDVASLQSSLGKKK